MMTRTQAARALRRGRVASPMRGQGTTYPFCVIVVSDGSTFQSYLNYYPGKTTFTVSAGQVLSFIRHNFPR